MNVNLSLFRKAITTKSLLFFLFCNFFLLAFNNSFSQKRQLSPSDKVTKIGLVDHSKIRNSYIAFVKSKDSLAKQHQTTTSTYTSSLRDLQKQEENKLNIDISKGGNNQEKIKQDYAAQKAALLKSYNNQQHGLNLRRMNITNEYEQKILIVINSVIVQKGFTEIKQLLINDKDQNGEDITDLIIEKLNKS